MVEQARRKRPRVESAGCRTAGHWLQSRPEKSKAKDDITHLPPTQLAADILKKRATHRGDYGQHPEIAGNKMSKAWPTVSLGELLRLERRRVQVEPEKLYQEIGIYCFGRGIFHKTPRTGFEVGDKDLFLMKQGDFILQVTFAWEGAIAIVSAAEDGMYGSTRYPTFRVDGATAACRSSS